MKFIKNLIFKNKCKHDWTLIKDFTTKSKIELYRECGVSSIRGYMYEDLTAKCYVQVMQCNTCGKLKKIKINLN